MRDPAPLPNPRSLLPTQRAAVSVVGVSLMIVVVVGLAAVTYQVIDRTADRETGSVVFADFIVEVENGNGFWGDGDEQIVVRQIGADALDTRGLTIILRWDGNTTRITSADIEQLVGPSLSQDERITRSATIKSLQPVELIVVAQYGIFSNLIESEVVLAPEGIASFGIDPDGAVFTRCAVDADAVVVGTAITLGAGGETIPVDVGWTRDRGTTYTDLFGGAHVTGGERVALGTIGVDDALGIRAHADHPSFDRTRYSIAGAPHVVVLVDGDHPPEHAPFDDQTALEEYLEPYVDMETGLMQLSPREAMVLVEFVNDLDQSAADFQDLVFLFDFETDTCPS